MKNIRNFENYKISKDGEIYRGERKISIAKDKDGYKYVMLSKNGERKNMKIHRLLYDTYINEISSFDIIDHIDMNRENNSLDNLRILSRRENCMNHKNRKEYYAIDIDSCVVYIFDNPNLFQERFNFINGNIRKLRNQICCNFVVGESKSFMFQDRLNHISCLDRAESIEFLENIEIDYSNNHIKKMMVKKCEYPNGDIEYFREISDFCEGKDFIERNVRNAISKNGIYKKCKFSKVYLFDIDSLIKSQRLSKAIDC